MYILEVLSGPLDGETWEFEREITIGRDGEVAEACITLDQFVSRRHARLWDDDGRLVLTDLSSRNGTQVEGKPVKTDVALAVGDCFLIGRTLLRVTRSA